MFWLALRSGYCSETIIRRSARAVRGTLSADTRFFHRAGIPRGLGGGGLGGDRRRCWRRVWVDVLQRFAFVLDVRPCNLDQGLGIMVVAGA